MRLLFTLLASCSAVVLQAQIPLFVTAQQGDKLVAVSAGGVINISSAGVGRQAQLRLSIYYQGSGSVAISAPQLSGSNVFGLSGASSFPQTLGIGGSASFTVNYLPRVADTALGQLTVPVTEVRADGSLVSGVLSFLVAGAAPSFTVSYSVNTDNNTFPLAAGGVMSFPQTGLNSSSMAVVTIANSGASSGTIESISLSGDSFQLLNLPLVPASVASGGSIRFNVRFTPQALGAATGQLTLGLAQGGFAINLQGTGTGPALAYEFVLPDKTTAFKPGETLRLPDTLVGTTASALVRVTNSGNADAQITAISTVGAAFSVTSAPALPVTLSSNQAAAFTLTFTPQQGGASIGSLRIGNDSFLLSGAGLATRLTVLYGGADLLPNATLRLPAVQVGSSSEAVVTVKNTGTAPTSIRGIQLSRTLAELALANLPEFPKQLDPDASFSFTVVFSPRGTEVISTVLSIDDKTFPVSGAGSPPPALPAYQFQGASGVQEPLQQPAVGLRLAQSYPLPLTGTLTLTAMSESFATDPSVQFAVGGRSASFQIPANSTQAVFANGVTSIRLQTGSVAESIILTPAFALQSGYDLTPSAAPALTLRVVPSAPRVLQMQIVSQSATSFTLSITGMATNRSVSQLNFQLQPAAGTTLTASQISLDVRSAFDLWFQNSQSQAFGSLFSFSVPFTLNLNKPTGPLSQYLDSVSAILVNAEGMSNPATVSFH